MSEQSAESIDGELTASAIHIGEDIRRLAEQWNVSLDERSVLAIQRYFDDRVRNIPFDVMVIGPVVSDFKEGLERVYEQLSTDFWEWEETISYLRDSSSLTVIQPFRDIVAARQAENLKKKLSKVPVTPLAPPPVRERDSFLHVIVNPNYRAEVSEDRKTVTVYFDAQKVVDVKNNAVDETRVITAIAEAYEACASALGNTRDARVDMKLNPSNVGLLFRLSASDLRMAQYEIPEGNRYNGAEHKRNGFDERFDSDFIQEVANSVHARVVGLWEVLPQ